MYIGTNQKRRKVSYDIYSDYNGYFNLTYHCVLRDGNRTSVWRMENYTSYRNFYKTMHTVLLLDGIAKHKSKV